MSRPSTWLRPSTLRETRGRSERSRGATWFRSADSTSFRPVGDTDEAPLVSLSDISEIELLILKRMREFTIGEHASLFHGSGFDFVGLRDWEGGDRFESIDWPQSSLTNFSPLIVREFEQPSTSSVVMVADRSLSTRCSAPSGVPMAVVIARAIATIGMSAVFFQDSIGLLTFDEKLQHLSGLRPRIGRGQVIHCLDAYQYGQGLEPVRQVESASDAIRGFMRKTSMVPVVSDFLFDDVEIVLRDLTFVNAVHDVFIALVDAAFTFEMPPVSAGWVEAFDVETGRSRVMSRGDLRRMAGRVREWQDAVTQQAKALDIDVVRLGLDDTRFDIALAEFVTERRLRRK